MKDASHNWILHDFLQVNGGAERLVLTLTRDLTGFDLGVSGIYPEFSEKGELFGVVPHVFGGIARLLPRVMRAVVTFGAGIGLPRAANCIIFSGVFAPLAVNRFRQGRKIYYCHTLPRFAFDREPQYVAKVPAIVRPLARRAIAIYREAYLRALRKMDVIAVNSQHSQHRLMQVTGLTSEVVYPPIDTKRFKYLGQDDYYLSIGRLEPNKRIDTIVTAFLSRPDKTLLVASGGSELERLKSLAAGASNIHFTGWLDDAQLAEKVGRAIAVIYVPLDEDFGMSAVEAMAAGKPVIGANEGGLRESIVPDETGILLDDVTAQAVAAAVDVLDKDRSAKMRAQCEAVATRFSEARHLESMKRLIAS